MNSTEGANTDDDDDDDDDMRMMVVRYKKIICTYIPILRA